MRNSESYGAISRVYLDNNATTPLLPELRTRWPEFFDYFGNPSSIHQDSRLSKTVIREARNKIADFLNCSPLEIIFNSGASEGNSSVLKSVFEESRNNRNEYIVSQIEHPSVLKTVEHLRLHGAVVHIAPVNQDGLVDVNFIKNKLSKNTALVSVMFANNETGIVSPIREISDLAHSVGALMHSDCVQAIGKLKFDLSILNVDYATFSAHKFYALKGTGFCYVKKLSPWVPLINGGGQERGRRGGTENVIGIAAINYVFDKIIESDSRINEMRRLRDLLEVLLIKNINGVRVTGSAAQRISNTSSLVIDGVDGETLLMTLDLQGYSVSTGAACSSGNPEPSPVLLAMGLSREEAQSSLRISLGWQTTEEQIVTFSEVLKETVIKLRKINFEEKKRFNEY